MLMLYQDSQNSQIMLVVRRTRDIIQFILFDYLMLEIQYTALHETLSTALEGV